MRSVAVFLATVCLLFGFSRIAEARVNIHVDLSTQTMHVSSANGDYDWPISSARSGFRTPRGSFGVQSLQVMHRSRKYHNSPMPHSIFFSGGYAIHGTYETGALGNPASHGCIRLAPSHAAALFAMVKAEGARIAISGSVPDGETRYASRSERHHASRYAAAQRRGAPTNGWATRSTFDENDALGYAPVVAPSFYRWMEDPVGY
jgi:hypothetical protein